MLKLDGLEVAGMAVRVRRHLALCSILMAAVLSGCVQAPTRTSLAPQQNDGAVLLKISDNLPIPAVVAAVGDSVTVRRLPDATDPSSTCYGLNVGVRGQSASAFLAGALPPGTYEFPTIGAKEQSVGECNHRDLLKMGASSFGKFRVFPGKLTYLGIIERTGANEFHKSYMIPMLAAQPENLDEVLREVFPQLQKLDTSKPAGWVEGSLPPGRAKANAYALFNAFGLFSPSQSSDGTWIFGSRAGVIRSWRQGQPRALLHDTGHRVSLVTTAVLADDSWLVAGDESTLLVSTDQGNSWQSRRGDLPYGLIVDISPMSKGLLLTLVDGKNINVYRGDLQSMHWRKVAHYMTKFAFWTGTAGVMPKSLLVGSTYVTSLPSRRMGVYHVASGTSEIRDLPGAVREFSASGDHVLRCRCVPTVALSPYQSSDLGKTWSRSTISRYSALPGMADGLHGVTVLREGLFKPPFMAYTDDGGKTWRQTSQSAGARFSDFFYSRDRKTAYASNDVDTLWSSPDGGRSWASAFTVRLPMGDMDLQ